MGIPVRQAVKVGSHIAKNKLQRKPRFPLVLMLEPLYRCNLACAGCGKIQHPEHILSTYMTPEECWAAGEECGAPVVSIAGGEPLMHPKMPEIVEGFLKRGKIVYLCTNAILLGKRLARLKPHPALTLDVHVDGYGARHDELVCRDGVFDLAIAGIKAAKEQGFRLGTNTTIYAGASPDETAKLFDYLMSIGVDGLMISPGYDYPKAPDQEVFLSRPQMIETFKEILNHPNRKNWKFNHSPLFLDFLQGKEQLECTAWGNPTRGVLGWQKPCYLMADGYAGSFVELMEGTDWERYGYGRDNRCTNCMMHSGYEASAVLKTVSSPRRMIGAGRSM